MVMGWFKFLSLAQRCHKYVSTYWLHQAGATIWGTEGQRGRDIPWWWGGGQAHGETVVEWRLGPGSGICARSKPWFQAAWNSSSLGGTDLNNPIGTTVVLSDVRRMSSPHLWLNHRLNHNQPQLHETWWYAGSQQVHSSLRMFTSTWFYTTSRDCTELSRPLGLLTPYPREGEQIPLDPW